MNDRIKRLREFIFEKKHHALRRTAVEAGVAGMAEEMKAAGMSYQMRAAERLRRMLDAEEPVLLPEERIAVTRTIKEVPSIYTKEEWDEISSTKYLHEKGDLCNISPDYEAMLRKGLGQMLREVEERQKDDSLSSDGKEFLASEVICLEAIQKFILRYAAKAEQAGDESLAETLKNVSSDAPQTLREALQLLRIMHFCLWEAGHYHNTLGRFDQYIHPYYIKCIEGQGARDKGQGARDKGQGAGKGTDRGVLPDVQQGQRPLPGNAAGRQRAEHRAGRKKPDRRVPLQRSFPHLP